jgi:hypothetical protein
MQSKRSRLIPEMAVVCEEILGYNVTGSVYEKVMRVINSHPWTQGLVREQTREQAQEEVMESKYETEEPYIFI